MRSDQNIPVERAISAALDWWQLAGVDCAYRDKPASWLNAGEKTAGKKPGNQAAPASGKTQTEQEKSARARPAQTGNRTPTTSHAPEQAGLSPPDTLAEFIRWWLGEPTLDGGIVAGRIPPRGQENPKLMVIVPQPEINDFDHLLSGPQGVLLDGILAAMGLSENHVYIASVLPRASALPDWEAIRSKGFASILSRHIELVRPARLLVLGNRILPLLTNDSPLSHGESTLFTGKDVSIPLLGWRSLESMLARPRWKAGLWQKWLDWTA